MHYSANLCKRGHHSCYVDREIPVYWSDDGSMGQSGTIDSALYDVPHSGS